MGFVENMARKVALGKARASLEQAYKAKRLRFRENGAVEYTDKTGITTLRPMDDIASLIWDRIEANLGGMVSLKSVDITKDHIKELMQEIKEKNETGR